MINLKEAVVFTISLARKAGEIILQDINHVEITQTKSLYDCCTKTDLKVEQFLITEIRKIYPDHAFLSEEKGYSKNKSDYLWIIDPIDGTKHFMKNIPLFTVCIALQYKDNLVLGIVFDPSTNRMYHAYKGGGAYLNDKEIKVSKINRLDHAFVYLDTSKIYELPKKEKDDALRRLNTLITKTCRVRSLGVGSLGMCYLAQGAYDAYFCLTGKTKYVDIVAGAIIVQEAEGCVSDLEGKNISKETKHYTATNGKLHDKFLKMLKEV